MPSPADRDQREAQLARIMARATMRRQREIIDLLGWPPDVNRVSPEVWAEITREIEDGWGDKLFLVFLTSLVGLATSGAIRRYVALSRAKADQMAEQWATQNARQLALDSVLRFKRRVGELAQRVEPPVDKASTQAPSDQPPTSIVRLKARLGIIPKGAKPITSKSAWEEEVYRTTIYQALVSAKTEVTRANVAGERAVEDEFNGQNAGDRLTLLPRWFHRKPWKTPQHPCPRCQALHLKPKFLWLDIDDYAGQGPPLHPHCCPSGTLIETEGGPVRIEDIVEKKSRPKVLTDDGTYQPVIGWSERHYQGALVTIITANRGYLQVTADHQVNTMTDGRKLWLASAALMLGSQVLSYQPIYNPVISYQAISELRLEHWTGWVYNIAVETNRNYFANCINVKNCDCENRYEVLTFDELRELEDSERAVST